MVSSSGADSSVVTLNERDKISPSQVPEEAKAVGRLNTLDQHMYTHQFRVDSIDWSVTDPVGKKLRVYEMHPNSHPYTKILAPYYLYWAGVFADDYQVNGTGLCGGKIRVIKIPPHVSRQDIDAMTIDELSFFDAIDIDPKVLSTVTIEYDDINTERAHRMRADPKDPNYRGCWMVVVVWAKLQSAMETSSTINIVVQRSIRDFTWSTFVPAPFGPTPTESPRYSFERENMYDRPLGRIIVQPQNLRVLKGYPLKTQDNLFGNKGSVAPYTVAVQETKAAVVADKIPTTELEQLTVPAMYFAQIVSPGFNNTQHSGGILLEQTDPDTNLVVPVTYVDGLKVGDKCWLAVRPCGGTDKGPASFAPVNDERIVSFGWGDSTTGDTGLSSALRYFDESYWETGQPSFTTSESRIYEYYNTETQQTDGYFKLYNSGHWTTSQAKPGTGELILPIKDHILRFYAAGPLNMKVPESAISYRNQLELDHLMSLEIRHKIRTAKARAKQNV